MPKPSSQGTLRERSSSSIIFISDVPKAPAIAHLEEWIIEHNSLKTKIGRSWDEEERFRELNKSITMEKTRQAREQVSLAVEVIRKSMEVRLRNFL